MGFFKNLFGRNAKRSGFNPNFNTNFNQVSLDEWNPYLRPPGSEIRDHHERLVGRCRNIADSDSYGAGIITTFHENVVTEDGISIQNVSENQELANVVDMAWRAYTSSKMGALSENMTFVQMQKQAVTAFLSDGEVFIRKHVMPDGFKWELIDPVRIPYQLHTRSKSDTRYVNGIMVENATGKVLGYRVDTVGIDNYRLGASINENRGEFVPADEMLHVALKRRIDQMRGVPLLKPVAGRIWKISQYENSALENAVSSAKKWGFLIWDKDADAPPDIDAKFDTSKSKSGAMFEMPAGMSVESFSSPFPDRELGPFVEAILLAVARAIGVSYPTLSGSLKSVNYASIRQSTLSERACWQSFRTFMFMELIQPLYECFFMHELAMGKMMVGNRVLSLMDLPEVMKVVTAAVQYAEIDPKNEQSVETARLQNLTVSPSDVIRQRGQDPEMVWQQTAKDIEAMKKAGIPDEFIKEIFLRQPMAYQMLGEVSEPMPSTMEE